jgi:adenine-specific DNA-methyltransferase
MNEQDFIKAGFTVVGTETNENKLFDFLKEHYPIIIKDNEINLQELKAVLGLPIDDKVNGYGLNFVGRNFARAKYAQKTEKELRLNSTLSKNIDTTENLVLKGDNLDSLKILKSHYSGKIKCIYIDPPYNTTSDEFIYPDNFKKEELEVLGLANLSNDDIARMEFVLDNPQNKKSHNGWLSFMYPRLLLARDLLSKDGVIFISIDDNEQANLKLLCDDVFGEENFVTTFTRVTKKGGKSSDATAKNHDYVLTYVKNINQAKLQGVSHIDGGYSNQDECFEERGFYKINQTLDYDSLS